VGTPEQLPPESPAPPTPAEAKAKKRRRRNLRISRDTALLAGGLLGVFHETVIQNGQRPSLLVLFAAMMGLPLYLRRNGL